MLMIIKLGREVTYQESRLTLSSCGLVRSRGKQKPLYLHCCCPYGHPTWQGGDVPREAPIVT